MEQTRSCGFLIWRECQEDALAAQRQFLLMRHPNRWDLPKGHVDAGETDLECALRELDEETGITADDLRIDPDFQFQIEYEVQYRGQGPAWKTAVYFLAELRVVREIRPTEHPEFAWFPWSPPHQIQTETIDPLLAAVAAHWSST